MTACNYCIQIAPRAKECICRIQNVEGLLDVLKAIDRVRSKDQESIQPQKITRMRKKLARRKSA